MTTILQPHLELAIFVAIVLGFAIGRVHVKGITLATVVALIAGLALEILYGWTSPNSTVARPTSWRPLSPGRASTSSASAATAESPAASMSARSSRAATSWRSVRGERS
jgi:hypothetical protein